MSNRLARSRGTVALLGLLSALLLVVACTDSGLRALRADFAITWPEDMGFDPEGLSTSVMDFQTVTTGSLLSIPVTLSNPGSAALDLCETYLAIATFDENGEILSEQRTTDEGMETLGAEIASSGPSGAMELGTGSLLDFEVRFTPLTGQILPDDLYFVVKHELNWDCDDNEGQGLYIPVFGLGEGEPVPDIHGDPETVSFANTEVGSVSQSHEVRIMNLGPGTLNITDVVLADDTHFSIVSDAVSNTSMELNDDNMIRVEFAPQAAGELSTQVLISSNDPNEDPYPIQLVGIGESVSVGKGPIAVCGADFDSAPFEVEQFDGSGSYDTDGLALSFQWVLTPPNGSATTLNSYTSATPTVTPFLDLAGQYEGALTVTNTAGQSDSCTQIITAVSVENFRIELFWGNPDDMDLHLLEANPVGTVSSDGDCYYANTNPDWGVAGFPDDDPALDLDDIPGTGPENINITDPSNSHPGWYQVVVHDYPWTEIYQGANSVTVNIWLDGVLAQTFNFQMSGEDAYYYVAKIEWPSGQIVACNGLSGCP